MKESHHHHEKHDQPVLHGENVTHELTEKVQAGSDDSNVLENLIDPSDGDIPASSHNAVASAIAPSLAGTPLSQVVEQPFALLKLPSEILIMTITRLDHLSQMSLKYTCKSMHSTVYTSVNDLNPDTRAALRYHLAPVKPRCTHFIKSMFFKRCRGCAYGGYEYENEFWGMTASPTCAQNTGCGLCDRETHNAFCHHCGVLTCDLRISNWTRLQQEPLHQLRHCFGGDSDVRAG